MENNMHTQFMSLNALDNTVTFTNENGDVVVTDIESWNDISVYEENTDDTWKEKYNNSTVYA